VDETSGETVSMRHQTTGKTVSVSSGKTVSGHGSGGVAVVGDSWGHNSVVGLSVDGGSDCLLDDWFTGNSHWVGNLVGGVYVDGGGDLDDFLGVERSVVGNLNTTFNIVGFVDGVDLGLLGDDGGVGGDGATEDGGDGDGEMRGGRFDDAGGVAGDVGGLAEMDLFGDDWLGLVDGGDTGSLGLGGVGGGDDRGDGDRGGHSDRGGDSVAEVAGVAEMAQAEVAGVAQVSG